MKTNLSLYIHIPFCVSKCRYCDFLSFPADENVKSEYVDCLISEIKSNIHRCQNKRIISIFFGGGTPSGLKEGDVSKLLKTVYECYKVDSDAEITIEVNPGTVTAAKLDEYKRAGINRLSIGLQSTLNNELRTIGRIHTWEEFQETYKLARAAGFSNINIDLISALPGQTIESYETSLRRVIALNPEHISAYSLQLEEGTYLYEHQDEYEWPGEELDRDLYHLTGKLLLEAGYERYEISNYSKPGYHCKHNEVYWTRGEYLGMGLGAASLMENARITNTSSMEEYLAGHYVASSQELSANDCMEEFMFLGLRLMQGVSPAFFQKTFNKNIYDVYGNVIDRFIKEGLIENNGNIRLTSVGIDVSNYVLAEFLLD